VKIINIEEVEYIAFKLAQEHLSFDEPIPDFTTRYPHILESCLAVPFQRFSKKSLYPSLVSKAGILLYLMIKNHPFQNGNKRIAITTLFVFLHKNNKWLVLDPKELYNFTVWIAQSPSKLKDTVVAGIEQFIRTYLADLNKKHRR
jgi:death-on-curing protein